MVTPAVAAVPGIMQLESRRETFHRLIEQYEPPLRRLARAYLRKAHDQEDLFQEIALALWQAIPNFRGISSERTWLYRIAHNVAISSSARLRRAVQQENPIRESFDPPSASFGAEHELLDEEKRRLLVDSIRGLPATDRQIILLHLENLSYAEIKEITGLSETAVAARLTRIREKLKSTIRSREGGSP